jgi:predicted dehydrogenase
MRVGVVGFGYWGPNLARNFNTNPQTQLKWIVDFSKDRLKRASVLYPSVNLSINFADVLNDKETEIVAIATPVSTHFEMAKSALEAGKHVWLEKPLTASVREAGELIKAAEKRNRVLLVDHTFVYTGAVRKIKELINKREIGELVYYDSTRVNLGLFQSDVNVIWDLAVHDISIVDFLFSGIEVKKVISAGMKYANHAREAMASIYLYLGDRKNAHIDVSWISPVKIRLTLIGGTKKMIVYDDTEPSEKVKVYDRGVEVIQSSEDLYKIWVQYRTGDMWAPKLDAEEALAVEVDHFVDCIKNDKKPITDGLAGLRVVKVLEMINRSLQ